MSTAFERIAEERIARAAAAGEFDRLPGAGQALDLGDELPVPPEVRMANRILRNAACLPLELDVRKEAREATAKTVASREQTAMRAALGRLAARRYALEFTAALSRPAWARYAPQLLLRLTRRT